MMRGTISHQPKRCTLYDDSESGHSPLIGWAADGFGLYEAYRDVDLNDATKFSVLQGA